WSRNVTFEPQRGEILDRNGIPLVTNKSAPSLFLVPRQIEDAEKAAQKLAPILKMKSNDLFKQMTKRESIVRLHPYGRKLSHENAKVIRSLNIKGVYIAEDSKRYYPYGEMLSHVLGFSGIDNQGLNGLELSYDKYLRGEEGYVRFYADAKGKRMPNIADEYAPPLDGMNLQLTIDARIQTIVDRELDNAEAMYSPDSITAIAMNPKTGEILAMSSRPNFHPEKYKEVKQEVYNRNLPIWSTYEPGSTFKIITLASALNEKLVSLEGERFYDKGSVEVGGARLKCWKRGGHGDQTFLQVVQNSCNPGFVELGQRLGKDKLKAYIKNFGFLEKTGIDLAGESRGLFFSDKNFGVVEQATTAFGQGVSVTPIQQITAVSAAVNGGNLYQPYIVDKLIDPRTDIVISDKTSVLKRKVISESASKQVRYALESVVAQGTGKGAYTEGYRVGGKTGTAQKVQNGRYLSDNYIVSFIGMAPSNDPEIVVYIAVDHPRNTVQFGGVVAAPIVGQILRDALPILGVKKQKSGIERTYTYPEIPDEEVPNLIGMRTKELQALFHDFELDVSGTGNTVVSQSPQPGTMVKHGSIIRVLLDDK
ncbi:MAG: stage V sporulation protein D, partial [Bacilli bacterium]